MYSKYSFVVISWLPPFSHEPNHNANTHTHTHTRAEHTLICWAIHHCRAGRLKQSWVEKQVSVFALGPCISLHRTCIIKYLHMTKMVCAAFPSWGNRLLSWQNCLFCIHYSTHLQQTSFYRYLSFSCCWSFVCLNCSNKAFVRARPLGHITSAAYQLQIIFKVP